MLWRQTILIIFYLLPYQTYAGLDDILPIDSTQVSFTLLHRGDKIGSHVVQVKKTDDSLQIEHSLDVVYKVGFVTLYELHHKSAEVWEDTLFANAKLTKMTSKTNENGSAYYVKGYADPSGFTVESSTGVSTTMSNVTTTNSLWNVYWAKKSSDYPEMLDSIDGSLMITNIEPVGQTTLGGIYADKYVVRTEVSKAESWFANNYLLKALLRRGGFEVSYERTTIATSR